MTPDTSRMRTAQFGVAVTHILLVLGGVAYSVLVGQAFFELLLGEFGTVVSITGGGFVATEILDYFLQSA